MDISLLSAIDKDMSKVRSASSASKKDHDSGSSSQSAFSQNSQNSQNSMQGSFDHAMSAAQGSSDQELGRSTESYPTPGQRARVEVSKSPTPPNNVQENVQEIVQENFLPKVTHDFIQTLRHSVENKFTHLAILEEKLEKFTEMAAGNKQLPAEFSVARELPGLAPGCTFSVGAKTELQKLFREHDLAYMQVLKDDLKEKIIPEFEIQIDESLTVARRKLEAEVTEEEIHIARRRFEEGLEHKRDNRKQLLEKKRASAKENKPPAKRRRVHQPSAAPSFNQWGGHQQQRQQSWRGRPRGRGRGRGHNYQ